MSPVTVRVSVIGAADDGIANVVVVVDVEVDEVLEVDDPLAEISLAEPSDDPGSSNETIPSSANDAPRARTSGIARFRRISRSWHHCPSHAASGSKGPRRQPKFAGTMSSERLLTDRGELATDGWTAEASPP
jgi:hypothetical protein